MLVSDSRTHNSKFSYREPENHCETLGNYGFSLERSTGITKKLPRTAQILGKRPTKNTVERLTCATIKWM